MSYLIMLMSSLISYIKNYRSNFEMDIVRWSTGRMSNEQKHETGKLNLMRLIGENEVLMWRLFIIDYSASLFHYHGGFIWRFDRLRICRNIIAFYIISLPVRSIYLKCFHVWLSQIWNWSCSAGKVVLNLVADGRVYQRFIFG